MSRFTFQGSVASDALGDQEVAVEWDIATPLEDARTVDLASGDNTITVPSGATLVVFVPPTTNTQNLTLKGDAGDTGIGLANAVPTVFAYRTGTFIVNAAGTVNGCKVKFI